MKSIYKILMFACFAMPASQARAEAEFPIIEGIEANYVGFGVGMLPDYVGSDDYTWGVLPAFRYEFGNYRNIEIIGNYGTINLIDDGNFKFGPAMRYRFGRDDDVDDDAVGNLPEIDDAFELGFTLSGSWVLNDDPRNRFVAGVDALWDTSGVSNGQNTTAYVRYWAPVSEAVDLGIAGSVVYTDDNFNETYFGVSPAGSAASGIPVFDAGGGVSSFNIQPMMMVHLSRNWHVGGGVRFTELTGDASDSPLVDDHGSSTQVIGGLGVAYTWGMKANSE